MNRNFVIDEEIEMRLGHDWVRCLITSVHVYESKPYDGYYEVVLLEGWRTKDLKQWENSRSPYRSSFPEGHAFSVAPKDARDIELEQERLI